MGARIQTQVLMLEQQGLCWLSNLPKPWPPVLNESWAHNRDRQTLYENWHLEGRQTLRASFRQSGVWSVTVWIWRIPPKNWRFRGGDRRVEDGTKRGKNVRAGPVDWCRLWLPAMTGPLCSWSLSSCDCLCKMSLFNILSRSGSDAQGPASLWESMGS